VPFVLTARLDAGGNLIGYSTNHNGRILAYAVTN